MIDDNTAAVQEQVVEQQTETDIAKEEQKKQEVSRAENLRIMADRAARAEQRAADLERMIQSNMAQNQPQKVQVEEEEDFGVRDDDYIEGKHFKKYVKKLKEEVKNTKKQFEEWQQQSSVTNAEVRLKSQFSDFDQIVNRDNLEKLSTLKPVLYKSIMSNQDIYDRGYAAYEFIKNSGMIVENYTRENKKIEENKQKPKSVPTVAPQSSDTPLTRIGDYDRRVLTEERREQIRRQVEEAKRYSR